MIKLILNDLLKYYDKELLSEYILVHPETVKWWVSGRRSPSKDSLKLLKKLWLELKKEELKKVKRPRGIYKEALDSYMEDMERHYKSSKAVQLRYFFDNN